jgi:predicted transglutaminase-like cysteine proteinase
MHRLAILVAAAIMAGALSACAGVPDDLSAIPRQSAAAPAMSGQSPDMAAGPAKPPSGFVDFCERNPSECPAPHGSPSRIAFTDQSWAMLQDVNISINNSIRPMDDYVHYGVVEYWAVPVDGYGDCEDYVLAKRKMLMLLGLPEPALRISVVLTPGKVRHAVLAVVTDRGDYVLDNLNDDILAAEKTNYSWLERQDPASRTGWVAMNQPGAVAEEQTVPLTTSASWLPRSGRR